jgi:chromosome segregation ATPase
VGAGHTGATGGDRRRLTVPQAAEVLGVTVDAVRGRIRRGTLDSERESGTVYVFLAHTEADRRGPSADQSEHTDQPQSDSATLISAKDETIAALQAQLEEANERDRENRRIIAALTSRIPAIEAPSEAEASEEAETVEEAQDDLGAERTRREMAETTLHEGMAEERRRREAAERERDDLRRELYARREPRESPETVEEAPDSVEPRSVVGGSQEAVRRPWWRRLFRG